MGWILGIHMGHDASVALLLDGAPVFCISEERITREKAYRGFPVRALHAALDRFQLAPDDFDAVAMDTLDLPRLLGPAEMAHRFRTGAARRISGRVRAAEELLAYLFGKPAVERQDRNERRARRVLHAHLRAFGFPADRVRFFDHHHCHAVGAFDTSPFDRALFATCDARGDGLSATVGTATASAMHRRAAVSELDSIGQFYGAVTSFLGYACNRHEGKITGLAAFGDPGRLGGEFMRHLRWSADGTYTFRLPPRYRLAAPDDVRGFLRSLSSPLRDRVLLHRQQHVSGLRFKAGWLGMLAYLRDVAADAAPEDVAAGVQHLAEQAVAGLVRNHLPDLPTPVVVSGGVFANVKVNKAVAELPGVSGLYVQPAMGDDGLSVGAALAAHRALAAAGAVPLEGKAACVGHTYLGPEFGEEEALRACAAEGVRAERVADLPRRVAEWLHRGLIVGCHRGRMEFGPRALGHRSILARATDREVNATLNARLRRTEFMPFAPSILEEHAPRWLRGYRRGQAAGEYMTQAYTVEPDRRAAIAAAVHVDGTARPQVVRAGVDPEFHRILTEYHRLSGVPAVVNTSMNLHEEPIVCTPRDAVRAFRAGCVDVLVLDGLVVGAPAAEAA
ncbi:MAG TPA: carbamoyltransferase C-terminal domain-containing protein [Longimicrobiaceae bacterium]|nr:carbamoyltransferase C-terminal domain-containing protein [Longimicrobiaceae bacterium]